MLRKLIIKIFFILFIIPVSLFSQDKTGCYFNIKISNETSYHSDSALKNTIVKVIEETLPSDFYRSFNSEEPIQVILQIDLIESQNISGTKTGVVFGVYAALRTYPLNFAFMPEETTIGITGDLYDIEFIRKGVFRIVNNVFGQYDDLKEILNNYQNSSTTQDE